MMLSFPRPFPMLATLLTLAGVLTLCALGHWQQERLVWKNTLQAQLDTEFAKDAGKTILSQDDLLAVTPTLVKRGTLSGQLDYKKQIVLRGQLADGKAVNFILIPLDRGTDIPIFVVAGSQQKAEALPPPERTSRQDLITGIARVPQWSRFVPENNLGQDLWYRADIPQMAAARGIQQAIPALFYLETSNVDFSALTPVSVTRSLRNDHRQYMMFWYAMAVILIGIYFLRFWRVRSEG